MTTYVDSSALVAIYVPERFSPSARRAVGAVPQIPFTQLHELEVRNAFQLLVGRGAISRQECRALQGHLQEDLESRRLLQLSLDLEQVFAHAGEFSRNYSARFLTRSLDLLHVAAAHVAMCTRFVSADARQLKLAKASGLHTVDIRRRVRGQTSPSFSRKRAQPRPRIGPQ